MAGGRVYRSNTSADAGSNNLSVLLQSQRVPSSSEPLDTLFIPGSSPSPFLGILSIFFFNFILILILCDLKNDGPVSGTRSMVSFEGADRRRSYFRTFDGEEKVEEDIEEYLHRSEKKRRLTVDQVQFLEKSFEAENKLEPDRKVQLAKDLGLQSRQVAIWFQNRRARWKTKQLEKDYDSLQASYNSLKADYDNLVKETDKLKEEVVQLTDKLLLEGKEKGESELPDAKTSSQELPSEAAEGEESKFVPVVKSDYTEGVHSSVLLEGAGSSYPLEPDQSDLSQDEEDNLSKGLLHLPSCVFPKLQDIDYSDPPAGSCNFGFPLDDHAFWSWAY
ncbi:hypothetical protein J1N35_026851 [Gossypium stocksii]|uniref:Homeobox-leucine zipper protein n=1 Tax=Gossypium stocksii TaxID=47602 RepID=A0A9D3ZZM4_9ROSI|nr:hypothetical protein J1N35_026851 [Gossypium stocksii]